MNHSFMSRMQSTHARVVVFHVLVCGFFLGCAKQPKESEESGAETPIHDKDSSTPSLFEIRVGPINFENATLSEVASGLDKELKDKGAALIGFKGIKVDEGRSQREVRVSFQIFDNVPVGYAIVEILQGQSVDWYYESGWLILHDFIGYNCVHKKIGIDSPVFQGINLDADDAIKLVHLRLRGLSLRSAGYNDGAEFDVIKNGEIQLNMSEYDWRKLYALDNLLRIENWNREHGAGSGRVQKGVKIVFPVK